jgi:uncharacterized membrane protein
MDDLLILILMLVGVLALYWALFGQWKYNRMLSDRDRNIEVLKEQIDRYEKEQEAKKKARKS